MPVVTCTCSISSRKMAVSWFGQRISEMISEWSNRYVTAVYLVKKSQARQKNSYSLARRTNFGYKRS
jgi:hypothetical protein